VGRRGIVGVPARKRSSSRLVRSGSIGLVLTAALIANLLVALPAAPAQAEEVPANPPLEATTIPTADQLEAPPVTDADRIPVPAPDYENGIENPPITDIDFGTGATPNALMTSPRPRPRPTGLSPTTRGG
jgi:hypothetical protein